MTQSVRVLLVEDDPVDAAHVCRELRVARRGSFEVTHVTRLADATEHLARHATDVVLLDLGLPDCGSSTAAQQIRKACPEVPIVVLTGQDDMSVIDALLRSGIQDYLVKGKTTDGLLPRSLCYAVERHGLLTQLDRERGELAEFLDAIQSGRVDTIKRTGRSAGIWRLLDQEVVENKDRLVGALSQSNAALEAAQAAMEVKNRRLSEFSDAAHQFVDHVSHEFRTPLTVIREFASIIYDGLAGDTSAEQREYLQIIVNRVDDLSALVDDMLDTSKLDAGLLGISRADCRVRAIVEHVGTILERRAVAAKAQLTLDLPADLPTVYCDAEKIGRVITNLVINGLKYCGEAPVIKLEARADPAACEVRVSIIDNGPGISPENLQTLFQRFRQIAGRSCKGLKGFGLGLSIARELVNLNLGDISVESQLGKGSIFSFTIPCADRRELLRRYLGRIDMLRSGCAFVSLISLTSSSGAEPAQLDELEQLVQHHIRRSDLLFRTLPHRWLLVAAANQEDMKPMITRIQKMHAEATRNRPRQPLPPLAFESLGAWSITGEADAFVEQVLAAASSREEVACG